MLDAVPAHSNVDESSPIDGSKNIPTSGYSMVELRLDDFEFVWGFLLLVLFQEQDDNLSERIISVSCITSKSSSDFSLDDSNSSSSKLYTIFFSVLQNMSTKRFFTSGFLTLDACRELLQVCKHLFYRSCVCGNIFSWIYTLCMTLPMKLLFGHTWWFKLKLMEIQFVELLFSTTKFEVCKCNWNLVCYFWIVWCRTLNYTE